MTPLPNHEGPMGVEQVREALEMMRTHDLPTHGGRTLAYVQVSGRDIGKALVRAGLAAVYVYHGVPFARLTSYQLAADAAKREARGVWGSCGGDFHSAQ